MASNLLSYRSTRPTGVLGYETPFAVGEVRSNASGEGSIWINVGPPPLAVQLWSISPLAALFAFFSAWFGLLIWFAILHPGALPLDKWLLLPSGLVWALAGAEFALTFRGRSSPSRIAIENDRLSFPFPTPKSSLESVPAKLVQAITVVSRPGRWTGAARSELVIRLERGSEVRLFRGYPPETLDQLADLIGPAVGLKVRT